MKTKTVQRRYNCRAYPTEAQKKVLKKWFGITRYVYNWAKRTQEEHYRKYRDAIEKKHRKPLSRQDMDARFTRLKQSSGMRWLYSAPSCVPQEAIKNYYKALNNWWKRHDGHPPKFKSKREGRHRCSMTNTRFRIEHPQGMVWNYRGSSSYPQSRSFPDVEDWKKMELYVSQLGGSGYQRLKVGWSGPLPAGAKVGDGMNIAMHSDGYYELSFHIKYEVPVIERAKREIPRSKVFGVDAGISQLMTGEHERLWPSFKPLEEAQEALRRAQKALSRKRGPSHKDGPSKRWKDQKLRVAKIHGKIRRRRAYYHHLVSRRLVDWCVENGYEAIALESLNVKGMMQNSRLAKSLSDVGIGGLLRKVAYKARAKGLVVVEVPQWYPSSKLCESCGDKNEKLTLSDRVWTCSSCETEQHRDEAAAKNIADAAFQMIRLDTEDVDDIIRSVREMKRPA